MLGISFDGVAISGIVNQFLLLADEIRDAALGVAFDPGFEFRPDKGNWGCPLEPGVLPGWVTPVRVLGDPPPPGYTPALAEAFRMETRSGLRASELVEKRCCRSTYRDLVDRIVGTFDRLRVRLVVIENGTIPDNPLVTEALYEAVERYGTTRRMGRFVLWRDHDLMWSSEPSRWGEWPYPGLSRPRRSPYTVTATITSRSRDRLAVWAPDSSPIVLANRFPAPAAAAGDRARFRRAHGIPSDAVLIARCTRVIPPKCIGHDLRLVAQLQCLLESRGDGRPVFLFVTGPTSEHRAETARLKAMASALGIERQVVWGDGALCYDVDRRSATAPDRHSISDLLRAADVSSFLTSYDYESFGNPPGEAMMASIPFVSSRYGLYDDVYGRYGPMAPLLPVEGSVERSTPLPASFVQEVWRLVVDRRHRDAVVAHNLRIASQRFSVEDLERRIRRLFDL